MTRAHAMRERKGADLIVLNDISDLVQGFDSNDNVVALVSATDSTRVPRAPKTQIAAAILDRVEDCLMPVRVVVYGRCGMVDDV